MLVWIDLETTGLDPEKCRVLEVAAIVTKDNLEEVARFNSVVYWQHDREDIARLHPDVIAMHTANGLFDDVSSTTAPMHCLVEDALEDFIVEHSQEEVIGEDGKVVTVKAQLAGSTISFDRAFMAKHLPRALKELHYRNVDVSTLNELARRFWPTLYETRPNNETKGHRGMVDVEESIRVCKHYITAFGGKL